MQPRNNLIQWFLTLSIPVLAFSGEISAQTSIQEGINQLKTNVANSEANTKSYSTNLTTVEDNIAQLEKLKSDVDKKLEAAKIQVSEQKKVLSDIEKNQSDLDKQRMNEERQLKVEISQIQELEDKLNALRANVKARENFIEDSRTHQKLLADSMSVQKKNLDEAERVRAQTLKSSNQLNADISEWKRKRKGYEIEISRWQKEKSKQQSLLEEYQKLSAN